MLNKLHFDFRNAKRAFLNVSFCKLDNIETNSVVQQTELGCGESTGHAESNQADALRLCAVNDNGADDNAGRPVAGSAVQVDDDDSDGLADVSDAAIVPHHSCSVVTKSEPPDTRYTSPSITTDYVECAERSIPSCSTPKNEILRQSDASDSDCVQVDSLHCEMEMSQRTDFPRDMTSGRRSNWTDRTADENQTAVTMADGIVLKPLSVLVSEPCLRKDSAAVALQSTSHGTIESSGGGGCSSTSPIVLYDDDDLDGMALTERVHVVQSVNGVKKSPKSENAHSLHNVSASSIKLEPKCKDGRLKVVRIAKRRRRKKHDSDDDVWSMQKKLLIMPGDKKFPKSSRSGKRKVRRNTFFPRTSKGKGHKSVAVEGMELPDLSTTLNNGADGTSMSDLLKLYDGESEVDNTVCRKWYVDVTGADLDIDYKRNTESSAHQKYLVSNKAAEQSVGELLPQYATDSECHHTNFSTSQETPPPSVASSDGYSSCDEPDQSADLDLCDAETRESADTKWLTIYTKLAHYIDGRRFDRLVNGVSVQVSAAVMDEAVAQVGQESLRLAKLTKHDVKELQDQVRLEEIYYRRVKKVTLSLRDCSNENVKHRSSTRCNVSGVIRRSASRRAARSKRTVDHSIKNHSMKTRTAEAHAANQRGASFSAGDKLCPPAVETGPDTVHLLSGDTEVAKSSNLICQPDGLFAGELSEGHAMGGYETSGHDHINVDGAKQRELATAGMDVHISRQASAANQSRMPGHVCDATPVGVSFCKQTSTMNNCTESEPVAAFGSPEECLDAFLRQELVTDDASLQKSNSFVDVDGMQHATIDDVATADAAGADSNEYMAAVALASLSMVAESQLQSTHQLLSSETRACTNDMLRINEQRQLTQRITDVAVTCKEFSPLHLSEQSKVSETVTTTTASSVKPSKHAATSNGHRLKAGERRGHRVSSTDKQHERCPTAVSERTRGTSGKQRTQDRRSHSLRTARHRKPVEENAEKLSTTRSSRSAMSLSSDSSRVAVSKTDKKNTESAGAPSDILQKSDKHAASDKSRRSRESCHSGEKRAVDRRKRSQVAGDPLLRCDSIPSVQPPVESFNHVTDVSVAGSDLPAREEDAMPLDYTSAGASANTGVLCSSQTSRLSVSSPSASSAPCNLIYSIVKRSDEGTKISLRLQRTDPPTSSLRNENTCVEDENNQHGEADGRTTAAECRVSSDLNSNNVSKSSQILPSFDDTSAVQVTSGKAETDVALSAIAAGETVPHSCSETATIPQSSLVLDNYTPDSPASPYREPEDIRSPSPVHAGLVEDDRAGEIRSPSPCDVESAEDVFHVVETSWDVRLSSPCEIQSPDCSDDEANDSIEQFDRHCNRCFQNGPVTIPLNMEETMPQNGS